MKLLSNAKLYSVEAMFAAPGMPFTRQRRAIYDYFAAADHAVPIAEAVQALRSAGIGEATVHRTVALLAELGLLVRVHTGGGEQCLVATRVGHYHPLICGVCRRVVDIDGEGDLSDMQTEIEAASGFKIYGHHLEIYGICPECLAATGGGGEDPPDASLKEV
jgi:Fe2+ or Zn2+ uptake regulation protein